MFWKRSNDPAMACTLLPIEYGLCLRCKRSAIDVETANQMAIMPNDIKISLTATVAFWLASSVDRFFASSLLVHATEATLENQAVELADIEVLKKLKTKNFRLDLSTSDNSVTYEKRMRIN